MINSIVDSNGISEVPLLSFFKPEYLKWIFAYATTVSNIIRGRTRLCARRVEVSQISRGLIEHRVKAKMVLVAFIAVLLRTGLVMRRVSGPIRLALQRLTRRFFAQLFVEYPIGQTVVPVSRMSFVYFVFFLLILPKVPIQMLGVATVRRTASVYILVLIKSVSACGALYSIVQARDGSAVLLLQ